MHLYRLDFKKAVGEIKPILWAAGNHEFYDYDWGRSLGDMRNAAKQQGIHFLENNSITIGGVDFLGTTLWTDLSCLAVKANPLQMPAVTSRTTRRSLAATLSRPSSDTGSAVLG